MIQGMSLEQHRKAIGDYTYTVTMLPLSKARPALVRVQRVLLPVIGEALSGTAGEHISKVLSSAKDGGSILDIDTSALLPALGAGLKEIALRLDDDDLAYLCQVFGETTTIEKAGKVLPLTVERQETFFMGKLLDLGRWLTFCIQVNFADFLGVALAAKLSGDPAQE